MYRYYSYFKMPISIVDKDTHQKQKVIVFINHLVQVTLNIIFCVLCVHKMYL